MPGVIIAYMAGLHAAIKLQPTFCTAEFQQICYSYLASDLAYAVTLRCVWLTKHEGLTDTCRSLQISAFTGSCS